MLLLMLSMFWFFLGGWGLSFIDSNKQAVIYKAKALKQIQINSMFDVVVVVVVVDVVVVVVDDVVVVVVVVDVDMKYWCDNTIIDV